LPSVIRFQHVFKSFPNGALALKRSEEHTSELQSHLNLVCRLLLEKKKFELKRLDPMSQQQLDRRMDQNNEAERTKPQQALFFSNVAEPPGITLFPPHALFVL